MAFDWWLIGSVNVFAKAEERAVAQQLAPGTIALWVSRYSRRWPYSQINRDYYAVYIYKWTGDHWAVWKRAHRKKLKGDASDFLDTLSRNMRIKTLDAI